MNFIGKLINRLEGIDSHLCVGLDTRYDMIPKQVKRNKSVRKAIFEFNREVISVTNSIAVAYKINTAFYEGYGIDGIKGLFETNKYLRKSFPSIPILADTKRAEMGDSALMIKKQIFDWLDFDCIMVTPWLGYDTVSNLVNDRTHGILVYVHDSNPSAVEFQELGLKGGGYVYEEVARQIVNKWNKFGNVFVEAGATYPKQLRKVRKIVGEDMPILTAGIVNQGGDINNLKGLFGRNNRRLIVNSSRGIIYAGINKKNYFETVGQAAEEIRKKVWEVANS